MKIIQILAVLVLLFLTTHNANAQSTCEQISTLSLEKLIPLLQKNDMQSILTTINTIEASCGENEFTLRTKLIYQIINKKNTDALYTKYLKNKFDEQIIGRWDNSTDVNYQNLYVKNKKLYNYVPLRHPTDSLLKLKAIALLNSPTYSTFNDTEVALLHLYADDIDNYLDLAKEKQDVEQNNDKRITSHSHQNKHTFGIHTGLFMPLGENLYFGNSFTGGLSIMSPFTNDFVFDVHYKFRVHSKAALFDFMYKNDLREVESKSTHVLSLGAGYKLLDRNKLIIMPKLNLGYGIIWTGLSETVYGEDDDGNETESIRFRNVQTLHSTFGVAIMRHISNKTYIGVESNIHLIPYKWDNNLKSPIPSKYASFEFFVRF